MEIMTIETRENQSEKVQNYLIRQREILYAQSLPVVAFNILLGIILAVILWKEIPHKFLLTWLTVLTITVFIRIGLVMVYKKNVLQSLSSNHWINIYGLGAFLMGIIWGACVPLFGPFESLLSMSMTALWPCGISAGALASYSPMKRVFFSLSLPALVPGVIYLTWFGPAELSLLGVGMCAYMLFLSIIAVYTNRTQFRAFEVEWENAQLARELRIKNEAITKLNMDMEQRLQGSVTALQEEVRKRESNERRLRDLIEHTPSVIAMFDRELRYLTASERWREFYQMGRRDLIGVFHADVFPDAPEEWGNILKRCLKGATERAQNNRIELPGKSEEWINAECSPWYDDTGLIGGVVVFNEVITEQKKAEEQIRQLMSLDNLTGLPNQYSLQQELARLCKKEQSSAFCLVLFEVRRFSEINSALGHEGADSVLKVVGERTQSLVKSSGYVARLGASIFAIVWPIIHDPHQALARFLNFKRHITEPVEIEGAIFEPQIVSGIALYPQHGTNPDMLLRNATAARHAARRLREGVAVYGPEYAIPASSLSELADLRRALEQHQFSLVYQPKLNLRTNQICGAEALIRWHHPERGIVPPDQFIPMAEESGMITSLTEWVIETAIRECARWRASGFFIGVSLNISTRDIMEARFMHAIIEFAKLKTVPVEAVTLEITESAVMDDPQGSFQALSEIRAAGWKLALDDYGTGYSSLAYLSKLPVHELKIDKSFILDLLQDRTTERIIRSTIILGHELDLEVTAEGIENEEIKTWLVQTGCDTGQGYGISKPLSADKFLEFCSGYEDMIHI